METTCTLTLWLLVYKYIVLGNHGYFNWLTNRIAPQPIALEGAHLSWKKGVCCGKAAFDITLQHKTTFSLRTRNQPLNFAKFQKPMLLLRL